MTPCPHCGAAGGFHTEACGHLVIPADWNMLLQRLPPGKIEVFWVDSREAEHKTVFHRGEVDVPWPKWAM
jgi:hypothetical protein